MKRYSSNINSVKSEDFFYFFFNMRTSKREKKCLFFCIYCFILRRDFATVSDRNGLLCFSTLATQAFNLLDNFHAFNDGTEDNVTVIQPRCFHGCNEEL